MVFQKELKRKIENYCNNHLPNNCWYENEFSFIKNKSLKKRVIEEFKATRFAYKVYEGIGATDENLRFEVRNQLIAYASIYEVVIKYTLQTYYPEEYSKLEHNNKKNKKYKNRFVSFKSLCYQAQKLGLIHEFVNSEGKKVNFTKELVEIYKHRNNVHIMQENEDNFKYKLELSKKAYRRMRPFVDQIKEKLLRDKKL